MYVDLNLEQLVHFPTRITDSTANTLDLIQTSNPAVCDVITALDALSVHTVFFFFHASFHIRFEDSTKARFTG